MIDRLSGALRFVENALLVALLSAMIALAAYQVVARNFFDTGILWGDALVRVLVLWVTFIGATIASRQDEHIRIDLLTRFIGERHRFSDRQQKLMQYAEELTRDNRDCTLVIAADYGGQWDLSHAAATLARRVAAGELAWQDITPELLDRETALSDLPRPDLCIRTGGDHRISNFMLWQFAYAELYFTETLWPDFGEKDFDVALADYSTRERRFGLRDKEAPAEAG